MKAIYQGKLYQMGDNLNEAELIDEDVDGVHGTIVVSYGDPELIVDPTDDQINNILPDYIESDIQHWVRDEVARKSADAHTATQRTIAMLQTEVDYLIARPIDQIVGCNVHGRLTYILDLIDRGEIAEAQREVKDLLKFFAKP